MPCSCSPGWWAWCKASMPLEVRSLLLRQPREPLWVVDAAQEGAAPHVLAERVHPGVAGLHEAPLRLGPFALAEPMHANVEIRLTLIGTRVAGFGEQLVSVQFAGVEPEQGAIPAPSPVGNRPRRMLQHIAGGLAGVDPAARPE